MITIKRFHFDTKMIVSPPPLTQDDKDTLNFAANTMAFILPHTGTFTGQQWIDLIRTQYDIKNGDPRLGAVVAMLEKYQGMAPN